MHFKSRYAAALAAFTVFAATADEPASSVELSNHAVRKHSLRASGASYRAFNDQITRNRAEKRDSDGDRISENSRGALPELSQESVHKIADLANEAINAMPPIGPNQCGVLRMAFREPTRPDLSGEGIAVWFSAGRSMAGGEISLQQSDSTEALHAARLASGLGIEKKVTRYDDLVTMDKPFIAKITIEEFGC